MKLLLDRAAAWLGPRLRRLWACVRLHPVRAVAALPALLVLYVLVLLLFTPGIGDIRKAKAEQPAVLMSADGKVLAEFRRANRQWVKLADISPSVVQALIATEDHRFYEHHGIDFKRTGAAVLLTLTGDRQGGSTITQQLARNLYPEDIGRAVSITRKIKEAITALKIEAVYSKDEILETYLNTVPFLYNAYGIEMAAHTYFDKPAGKLDLLESATLVGMLKGTSYYNPVTNPERAQQRRNVVLAQMVKHNKLDAARLPALQKRPLKVDFERQGEPLGEAPHLARQLRRWLIDWADRNGYDIHADGLVVRTTIDSRLQALANQAVTRQMDALQKLADARWSPRGGFAPGQPLVQDLVRETAPYRSARASGLTDTQALKPLLADAEFMKSLREDKTRLAAGFMALDPHTGQVRAWVGSRDFMKDQFDHVQQARRQPGSTFKPFVYGAAFEQGISPLEVLMDEPVEIDIGGGQVWRPTDGGEPSYLPMTLRDGLAYSKNVITAQLMQRVGPQRVAALARAMGVRSSRLEEVYSLALGTSPVTLKEMVTAYGTLANGGNYLEPVVVLRVEDRTGKVLESFAPAAPEAALPQAADDTLLDTLRGVIDRGTGAAIRSRFGIQADVAGKTGTTQDNTDGWFMLMHPQLVAGAWVGFNDSRITMSDSWGQGARSALPIVGDFFQASFKTRVLDAKATFAASKLVLPAESTEPLSPLVPAQVKAPDAPGGWATGFGGSVPAEAWGGSAPPSR
ncbi:MAG: transglycosylase domain-containing protein [Ramlibacter sp.]|nr:transglycosylase domain-containing protein [Ramlibacter sp.]